VTNLVTGTLAFPIIVILVIPARFIVLGRARRTVTLFMNAMLSDWMTGAMSLTRLRLSERAQHRERQRRTNTHPEGR